MDTQLLKLSHIYQVSGYLPSMNSSSARVKLKASEGSLDGDVMLEIQALLENILPHYRDRKLRQNIELPEFARILLLAVFALLERGQKPIGDVVDIICQHSVEQREVVIFFPIAQGSIQAVLLAVKALLPMFSKSETNPSIAALQINIDAVINNMRKIIPRGKNTCKMIECARNENIPFSLFANNTYQFGWGSKSRLLDSTITDQTPGLGVSFARQKHVTSDVLRLAGIPVPEYRLVMNYDQASWAAQKLGFPIVVKPAMADGGRGVTAGIKTMSGLENAYKEARKFGAQVLIEQFIEGDDFRLHVFQGEVFRIVQRSPAGVVGDSVASIGQLIAHRKEQVKRGEKSPAGTLLQPINVDDEVRDWLESQNFNLDSVPDKGTRVRLRGAANVTTGGISTYPDFVHPDNRALAARAARALRLDIAGIDLLIPDIQQSWTTQRAAVCEVNAQPQVSAPHIPYIVKNLLPCGGRIPIVFILGGNDNQSWYHQFVSGWYQQDRPIRLGIVRQQGVWLDKECICPLNKADFADVVSLLRDTNVDAVVAFLNGDINKGLPVDRADILVVAGSNEELSADNRPAWLQGYASMMDRIFVTNTASDFLTSQKMPSNKAYEILSDDQLAEQITNVLLKRI